MRDYGRQTLRTALRGGQASHRLCATELCCPETFVPWAQLCCLLLPSHSLVLKEFVAGSGHHGDEGHELLDVAFSVSVFIQCFHGFIHSLLPFDFLREKREVAHLVCKWTVMRTWGTALCLPGCLLCRCGCVWPLVPGSALHIRMQPCCPCPGACSKVPLSLLGLDPPWVPLACPTAVATYTSSGFQGGTECGSVVQTGF